MNKKNIYIFNGNILPNYLSYNFIEYISKIRKKDAHSQEVFLLINNPNKVHEDNIIFLAENLKRINIVTYNINKFKKLESFLESNLGISITVTNNKRKSLLKANIIINFDFDSEMVNNFNINSNAIILSFNNKIDIKSKLFNGINIQDYRITYNLDIENYWYKSFDKKVLYERRIMNRNYNEIIATIRDDKLRIVNLVGQNGIINEKEFCSYHG